MTFPLGKKDSLWMANSGAMRDAIAAADGLKVGDKCSIFGVDWHWTGVTWVEEGGGAAGGIYINVKTHGMIAGGDGDTNTTALQAAIDAAAGFASWATVIFPAASVPWNCNGQVQLKTGVRLLGEGAGKSILSFAGGTGSFTHDGALWGEGTVAQIEAFDADANEGDRAITLASVPSAAVDDLVLLYDPTDSSWDTHSVHQRGGEFAVVEAISGDDIVTVGALLDGYLLADAPEVHKVTPIRATFEGLSIVGRGVTGEAAVWLDFARDVEFVRCPVTNAIGHGVWLSRSYRTRLDGCQLRRTGDAINFALYIQHCQDVQVDRCNVGSNSTLAAGILVADSATEKTGAFPSRQVVIDGGTHQSKERAIQFSTHTDLCTIRNVDCDGEVFLAGGRHILRDARIRNNERCVDTGDFHYASFTVENCELVQRPGTSVSVIDVDVVGTDEDLDHVDNAIIVSGNKVSMASANTQHAIEVTLNTDEGPRRLEISGNRFSWDSVSGGDYAIDVQTGAGYGSGQGVKLEELVIEDNKLFGGGVFVSADVPNVRVKGNTIKDASDHAVFFAIPTTGLADTHTVKVLGNTVQACTKNVVHYSGFDSILPKLYIQGNVVDEWGSGTAQEKVPVWVDTADSVAIRGNVFGGGPGTDFAVCHMDGLTDLSWGGNTFPEVGTSILLEPTAFVVENFWADSWSHTESLKAFTQANRDIAWGTDLISFTEALHLPKIAFSRDVWLMEVRVIADTAWENLNTQIFFDNNGTPEVTSGTSSEASNAWFIYQPKLFVPKNTDVRVNFERDTDSGDGFCVVTWAEVGTAGGPPPVP